MKERAQYFLRHLAAQGKVNATMFLVILGGTLINTASLLAGADGWYLVATVLVATVYLTARITAWWPPRCPCGVRHWDEDDDEGPACEDSHGLAA